MSKSDARIEVYTDGECPLCQWMRAKVEPFDRDGRIEWLNFRDPEVLERAAPYTFEQLNEEMHVHDAQGRWTGGYLAWAEVLRPALADKQGRGRRRGDPAARHLARARWPGRD